MLKTIQVFAVAVLVGSVASSQVKSDDEVATPHLPGSGEKAYFVAPLGDDSNSGAINAPFRTLERARDAIAASKPLWQRVSVYLRGGVYRTTSPLEFDENDSGTAEFPITYRAFPGETPIVKGSRLVRGAWTAYRGSIQRIDLPGQANFRELYVSDVKAVRPRTPNFGDFHLMVADSKIPNKAYLTLRRRGKNRLR